MPTTRNKDIVIEYIQLLHDHGVGSLEAQAFKESHGKDGVFLRRARGAERLMEYRDEILEELAHRDAPKTNSA